MDFLEGEKGVEDLWRIGAVVVFGLFAAESVISNLFKKG